MDSNGGAASAGASHRAFGRSKSVACNRGEICASHRFLDAKLLSQTLSYVFPRDCSVIIHALQHRVECRQLGSAQDFTNTLALLKSSLLWAFPETSVLPQIDQCCADIAVVRESDAQTDKAQNAEDPESFQNPTLAKIRALASSIQDPPQCRLHMILFLSNAILFHKDYNEGLLHYASLWSRIIRPLFSLLCTECQQHRKEDNKESKSASNDPFVCPVRVELLGCSECEPDALLTLSTWLYVLLFRAARRLSQTILNLPTCDDHVHKVAHFLSEVRFLCRLTKCEAAFWKLTKTVIVRSLQRRKLGNSEISKWLRIYVDVSHTINVLRPTNNEIKESILSLFTTPISGHPDSTRAFLKDFPALANRVRWLEQVSKVYSDMTTHWDELETVVGGVLGVSNGRCTSVDIKQRLTKLSTSSCSNNTQTDEASSLEATKHTGSNVVVKIEDMLSKVLQRPVVLSANVPRNISVGETERLAGKLKAATDTGGESASASLLDVFMALHGTRKDFFSKFAATIGGYLLKHVWRKRNKSSLVDSFVKDCVELFKLIRFRLTKLEEEDSSREPFVSCEQLLKDCQFSLNWQRTLNAGRPGASTVSQPVREVFVLTRYCWPAKVDRCSSSSDSGSSAPSASAECGEARDDSGAAESGRPVWDSKTDESLSSNAILPPDMALDTCLNKWATPVSRCLTELEQDFALLQPNRELHFMGNETRIEMEIEDDERGNKKTVVLSLPEAQILSIIASSTLDSTYSCSPITQSRLAAECNCELDTFWEPIRLLLQKGFIQRIGKGPLEQRELVLSIFDVEQSEDENIRAKVCTNGDRNTLLKLSILATLKKLEKVHGWGIAQFELYPEVKKMIPDLPWHEFDSVLLSHVESGVVTNCGGYFRLTEQNYN